MSDSRPGGSGLTKTIDLKINVGKTYVPAKHCVFCLEEGRSFNPFLKVTSSENGREKIKQVIVDSVHQYRYNTPDQSKQYQS